MCVVNIAEEYLAPLPTGGRGGGNLYITFVVNPLSTTPTGGGRGGKGCRYRDA